MTGSRWVIIWSWLYGSLRSFLYYPSVYSWHLFLIFSSSLRSTPFLSFIVPIFVWNVLLVSLVFLKRSLDVMLTCIRVFSNESTLRMRWPKHCSFSFSIIPSKEIPGLISFRMDWLDLLAVQRTLKSLLQYHSSKASILRRSAFLTVQLSHPYMTTGKTIALTRRTFVGKVMSLLLNILSRLVISWLIGKDSDAGRDWGQEEKGTTEDEMAGWHHWLDGRESGWTPGGGDGQGGLACCDSWGRKESDTTERLIWSDLIWSEWHCISLTRVYLGWSVHLPTCWECCLLMAELNASPASSIGQENCLCHGPTLSQGTFHIQSLVYA